ncbi:GntR family transcriptional regulator [Comamonas antarctica]|uniref:GntR family transcriptional regulator n=1 Tax=Comamonas antarctica TaxID=2743470 RepID=A0A6N1WXN0_9BURK|nr:GntR family transcriptional regulator [Comamonas antarctica]QKV51974.1 GntR family transcriptional regulator [Comamonas antarctica]
MKETAPSAATPAKTGSAKEPLYRQVVAALRSEILQGLHPVGQNLPTEGELAERFQLSRHTIREALRELRLNGVVASRRGSGTVVLSSTTAQSYLHETGSLDDLLQYAASRLEIRHTRIADVAAALVPCLNGASPAQWLRLEGVRFEEGNAQPFCWTQVYLHPDHAGVARLIGKRSTPVYELIEETYGVRIGEAEQTIRMCEATDEVAALLGLAKKATVVELLRVYRLTDGKVVEISRNLYASTHFSLTFKLRRAEVGR